MMNFWEAKIKYFFLNSFFLRIVSFFIFLGFFCWGVSTLKTSFFTLFPKKNAYLFLKENSGSFSLSRSTCSSSAVRQQKIDFSQRVSVGRVVYGELSQAHADALFSQFFKKSKSATVFKKILKLPKKNEKKEVSRENKNDLPEPTEKKNNLKKSEKGELGVIKKSLKIEKKQELASALTQKLPLQNFTSFSDEKKILLENKNPMCDIRNQSSDNINNTVVDQKKLVKLITQENEIIIDTTDHRGKLKEEHKSDEPLCVDLQAEQYHQIIKNYENRVIKYLLRYPGRLPSGQITIEYISEERVSILSNSQPISLGLKMYLNQIIKAISVPYFLIGKKVTILL